MAERLVFIVPVSAANSRLDKYLSLQSPVSSRSRAEYLIDSGLVTVNGKSAKSSYKLKVDDQVEVDFPAPKLTEIKPLDISLDIQFEDDDIIVVNKPAGLVVHPAAGHENDTLVNALMAHTKNLSMKFGEDRPGIVHRIDKETSGLLVVAKNDFAHQHLSEQFKARSINRLYEAVCIGEPKQFEAKITSIIARDPNDRKRFASLKDTRRRIVTTPTENMTIGKIAITSYTVLKSKSTASLIRLKLFTGRTHQIRVHMSELGHPLLGDKLYSTAAASKKIAGEMKKDSEALNRFLLHAKVLGFVHPKTEKEIRFEVDWATQEKAFIQKWFP
jgi:23S rRNA pseudouridine1911/1915/1917 synthase